MGMVDLNDYFYFVHVVEKHGFSAAARALNMPKSRLSRHVSQLEERLKVRLIQRTSRSISVTEMGRIFYEHARGLVDTMELAEASVQRMSESISGKIAMSCSVGVAQFALMELVSRFVTENPGVEIHQHVSNESIDLVAEGIDLAVRGHTTDLPDSSLVQRHLVNVEWHLFSGRQLLEKHGTPGSPYDLNKYDFLKVGWRGNNSTVNLTHKDGIKTNLQVSVKLYSDDMATLKHAAEAGLGIVALPAYVCREEVRSGHLVRVLPEWVAASAELSLLMPSRIGIPPQVKALSDFLRAEITAFTE